VLNGGPVRAVTEQVLVRA